MKSNPSKNIASYNDASKANWPAVLAITAGTFLVVTVENIPMGLLTAISSSLKVSNNIVALTVTASGLMAAITAPSIPLIIRRLDRKAVLVGLLGLMIGANILTAFASNIAIMLIARLLVGISIGGFWAFAAGLAVRLVPDKYVGKATSLIFLGATAAIVFGLPLATLIGGWVNWQAVFIGAAGLGVLIIGAISVWLPKMPADKSVQIHTLLAQLRHRDVRGGILTTFLLVCGHYSAFAFISPLLQYYSHIHVQAIGLALFLFGGAGIIGNLAAGAIADRSVRKAIITVSALLATSLLLFPILGGAPMGAIAILILWGLTFGGLPVGVQTWIIKKAPHIEAATSLNTAMFNAAIASGALYGGLATTLIGLPRALWLSAVPVSLAIIVMSRIRETSQFGAY